jgi:hypothetical protein
VNLAQRLNAGFKGISTSRRVATDEPSLKRRYATQPFHALSGFEKPG